MTLIHSNGIINKLYSEWGGIHTASTLTEKYPELLKNSYNAIILAIYDEEIYKYFEYMVIRKEVNISPYEYGECASSELVLIPFKKGKRQLFLKTKKEIYKKSPWLEDDEKLILEVM